MYYESLIGHICAALDCTGSVSSSTTPHKKPMTTPPQPNSGQKQRKKTIVNPSKPPPKGGSASSRSPAIDQSGLSSLILNRAGLQPRPFQLEAIKAQLLQKDVVIHAGTGMGKTLIAGPHYHPSAAGKLTIMVSRLLALQDEQASRHSTYQTL